MRTRRSISTGWYAAAVGLLALLAGPVWAGDLSTSVMSPTAVGPTGIVERAFPEGKTSFYLTVDVKPGDLLTQIRFEGRPGAGKAVDLALLDASGRRADCPAPPVDVVVTPPSITRVGSVPVAATRCEQRLLLGADLFFDFDHATIRGDAEPKLAEIAGRVQQGSNPVVVEGHTDAKGADDYNQHLSEERADAVKTYLVGHGTSSTRVTTVGWGERKPVAPNEQADGSDDPSGRQRNRRVEIVVNTCT